MFDYFYGAQSDQFSFYRVPKVMFTDPAFQNVSAEAKILYGLFLDRMGLSARNNWVDEQGRVYIIYTIDQIMKAIGCSDKKVNRMLRELEVVAGLIERKRQGLGKPNLIYVKNFLSVGQNSRFLNRKMDDSGVVETQFLESSEVRGSNTEINSGSTPILVDKGQKGRGTASCNLPATRYIIEANPLNVLKPRAFRFAACIMELIPSQTAFVMRW